MWPPRIPLVAVLVTVKWLPTITGVPAFVHVCDELRAVGVVSKVKPAAFVDQESTTSFDDRVMVNGGEFGIISNAPMSTCAPNLRSEGLR